jgi:Tol biopolymer transport system component
MERPHRPWLALASGAVLVSFVAAASPAMADPGGENGRILFVSGRAPQTDATARLYLLPVPSNSVGGGTVSPPIVPAGGQYRHPTWSPDRTKIAFANGDAGVYDIFVLDLTDGSGPVQISPSESPTNLSADRPAWSPDGTTIVYEQQPSAGSADRYLVRQSTSDLVPPINPAGISQLTAPGGMFEGKPAWTPDSSTVYFHRNDPNTAANSDIYRMPAAGGTQTLAISDSGISEAQPSISPDGTRICYTLTNGGFNSTADVLVATLNPNGVAPGGLIVSKSNSQGDYNCTWSPDGTMIAYVNGVFSTGRLVMVRADNTSPIEIELAEAPGAFDGNPVWAPDGRPECPDVQVITTPGTPVTFSVTCTDTGPAYEQSEVREFAGTQPSHGSLDQDLAGDPFTYVPTPGFKGTDSFEVRSFDELGFGIDRGTVTIRVVPADQLRCGGRKATIAGSPGKDVIKGTPGRDVIVGLGGKDRIKSRGGKDIVCGGPGNDTINGGSQRDRLFGGPGSDLIRGGPGRDTCLGGPQRDTLRGCE